jgi:hypothetical protein
VGFLSKIWKGVKKTVKKIGKGIKGAFKKFGKFMNKIGIVGQVAMMFVLPGIGAALGGAFTGAAGALATNTLGGALGAVGQAAGKVMQFVGNAVSTAGNVYSNITKGVTETLGNFAKTATNKLAGKVGMENVFSDAAANFFGPGDSAFGRSFGENSRFSNLTSDPSFIDDINKSRKAEILQKTDPKAYEEAANANWAGMAETTSKTVKTEESLLSKAPKAIKSFATEKLEKGVDTMVQTTATGLGQRISGTEPEAPVQNNYVSSIPTFDTASQGAYGAPEIMNARAFEQQVTTNPAPYAYTAFQYGNYMAKVG